ncbi:MAG: hypothetical protein EOP00_22280 [Pedobacter sp.]|nr:MAG: hypothetical protein EOP00_22280 [Pedobacter sp.]
MGPFDNLFNKKENGQNNFLPEDIKPFTSEPEFLEKFGALALDKQRNLYAIIEDKAWSVDMAKEEICFGGGITFPIQVLGSYAYSSETWLWIWDNVAGGYAQSIMQQALALKKYGEANNVDLLTIGKFDATNSDLHLIGMVASEMFNSGAYYLADYGQGIMVVTVKANLIDQFEYDEHLRILTVFPEFISTFEVNHKTALTNYLTSKGYQIEENNLGLSATKNGKTIKAEFDELSRLTKLNG